MSTTREDPQVYLYQPDRCPWTATWNAIGGKWKGVLWWRLSNGLGRFGELRRAIPQITKKVLTQQLRELERDGIVRRDEHDESPPRVEYSLTDYGRSLGPVIEAVCGWGVEHLKRAIRANGEPADRAGSGTGGRVVEEATSRRTG